MNIYSTMANWKMEMKKISSANQQLSAFGNATRTNAFQIIKNVYPLPLKANHQIFSILTICQIFFLPESAFFAYRKGSTKRQCTIIKQAFIKNYNDIDDKYNSVSSPEIEVETTKKN